MSESTVNLVSQVRLTDRQIEIICRTFRLYFNASDRLLLFGSRADLTKKGGDIDLYIETGKGVDDATQARSQFYSRLQSELGEQKIDIVLRCMQGEQTDLLIYKVAKEEGIQLI